MLRLYRIPFSTNVERITLALAYKQVDFESVWLQPDDRSAVRAVSGQELVPVLVDGEQVLVDSPRILEHLERRFPEPPLYPGGDPRRVEAEVFIDWFNRVWKRPPNAIADHLAAGGSIEDEPLAPHRRELAERLDVFERLLHGRPFLLGDLSAADVVAYPFLKYAAHIDPDDDEVFHQVLHVCQPLDAERHRGLRGWLERMDALPGH